MAQETTGMGKQGLREDQSRPAYHAIAVTPNDSTDLTTVARALWIGVAGDVTIYTGEGGATGVLFKCTGGTTLPVRTRRVLATGTTATSIVALY